jgi:NAD(P)-dependent dehydrogenase (short-subunit alcohol dehydrogenase family)
MAGVFRNGLFEGRTAFVAGGTSGINLGIAERFAQLGAAVTVVSRSPDKVQAAVRRLEACGARAFGQTCDVREYDAVAAALGAAQAQFGPIDMLVSGAAGNFVARALDMSSRGFRTVVDIDLVGTFNVLRAAHEHLRKPGAAIVNVSAPQAYMPMAGQAHVGAAKAGVDMLTRNLAVEWGPDGIRVNSIVPGPIEDTEGMRRLGAAPGARERLERSIPLGRYGRKDEIADLAVFLCSDAAQYVTGAIVVCDGGQSLLGSVGFMPD